jgi:hypothetical protein
MSARSDSRGYITQFVAGDEAQLNSSLTPIDLTLIPQTRHKHALTTRSTFIHASNHLIPDKSGKCVSLVIDLIESVLPKHIEYGRTDHKSADSHPESVCESGESKSDDENGEKRRDENDKRFGSEQVEIENCKVIEKCHWSGSQIHEPVGDDGKEKRNENSLATNFREVTDKRNANQ